MFTIGVNGKGGSDGSASVSAIRQVIFEVNNLPIQNGDSQLDINNKFNTQLTNINAYLVDFQERVRGVFTSLTQLNTAIPNPRVNDIAIVSDTNTLYYCRILNQWSSMAISQATLDLINNLKGGVSSDGDNLKKLYDLIQINKNSIVSIISDINTINATIGDFFSTTADVDSIINRRDEIVDFLSGIAEGSNLSSMLNLKADLSSGKHLQNQSRPSNVSYNGTNGILSFTWADGSQQTIDLPLELVYQSASFNSTTKILTFTLTTGSTVDVDLSSLVDVAEVILSNQNPVSTPTAGQKLYYNSTTKEWFVNVSGAWEGDKFFVSASEKTTWNGKQNSTDNSLNTTNKTITGAINENKTNIDTKQNLIPRISTEAEMLALANLTVGYIVARTDLSAILQLKVLPSNELQNWEVLVSTGGSVSIPSSSVEKVYLSGALPSVNGLYAFAAVPSGGMPTGARGDILKLENSVWTIEQTFADAPASIFSKLDKKTYNKKVDSNNNQIWQIALEPSFYIVQSNGDNTKQGGYTTLQNAVDAYNESGASIGTIMIYDATLNETVTINSVNLHIEGLGTKGRGQTQISKIILGPNSHRITLKNILLTQSAENILLEIQSTGTLTESGTPNVGRGKHILSGVSFSTGDTIAINVSSINNFLTFENCDIGNKIINLSNRVATPILASFTDTQNGLLVIGSGYVINKFNSPVLYISSLNASSYLLDLDIKTPIGYSLIRLSSALGGTTPVALGQLIINDDAGGNLANLKCKTAYNVAANIGVGTAIDLTKYDIQVAGATIDDTATSTSKVYSSQKTTDLIDLKEDKIIKTNKSKQFVRINTAEDGFIFEDLLDSNNKIKIGYIPAKATFTMKPVADEIERFALTINEVQLDDAVYQEDVKKLFFVIDESNLDNESGYLETSINIDLSDYFNLSTNTTDNITEGEINKFSTNSLVLNYFLTGISTATTWAKLTATNTFKDLADFVNLIFDKVEGKADKSSDNIFTGENFFNGKVQLNDLSTTTNPITECLVVDGTSLPSGQFEVKKFALPLAGDKYSTTITTSSLAIVSTGTLPLTVGVGFAYNEGQIVKFAYDSTNYMICKVEEYLGSNLLLNVISSLGSGSYTNWTISLAERADFVEIKKAILPNGTISSLIADDTLLKINGNYTENISILGLSNLTIEGEEQVEYNNSGNTNNLKSKITGTLSTARSADNSLFTLNLRLKNFTLTGAVSLVGIGSGDFFTAENIIFKSAITINISGIAVVNFKFVNCRFEAGITVSDSNAHRLLFKGCDLNNRTITNNNAVLTYENCKNIFSNIDVRDVLGNGTGGRIDFKTKTGTLLSYLRSIVGGGLAISDGISELVNIKNQRIGIGISSPLSGLHLHQPSSSVSHMHFSNANTATGLVVGIDADTSVVHWNSSNSNTRFATNNTERMRITANGRVGIGIYDPKATLHVAPTYNVNYRRGVYLDTGGYNNTTGFDEYQPVSIMGEERILGQLLMTYSDKRIKNIIGISDRNKDLELLNKIQITEYSYKDFISKGRQIYKKVIAQQIQEILPVAVSKTTNFIPNVYLPSKSITKNENKLEIELEKDFDLKTGDTVRLITDLGKTEELEVLEIKDKTFTVELGENSFEKEIFVYGKKIDDFLSVDYDALSMLNISATQELCKKIENQENEIEILKTQIEELKQLVLNR